MDDHLLADRPTHDPRRIALYCALAAVLVGLLAAFVVVRQKDMRVSALVRLTVQDPLAQSAVATDPDFALYPADHYDGIYFYAMARDPFLTEQDHKLIDLPGARYGHVLYAWAAGIASLGNDRLIPLMLFLINIVSMGVCAWAVSMLARDMGWSPWAGLLVAANPGFIYAITVDTSEVFGSALVALFLLAWFRKRWLWAAVLVVAVSLAKEIFLFVVVGLAAWEILRGLRGHAAEGLKRRLSILALGPLALFLWQLYLAQSLGYWAFKDGLHVLTTPMLGWAETFSMATSVSDAGGGFEAVQIAAASLPLLMALGVALTIGVVFALRLRTPLDIVYLGMALLSFSLTWRNLYFAKDMIRQMSPVLLLLPAAIAGARSGSLVAREAGPPAEPAATL